MGFRKLEIMSLFTYYFMIVYMFLLLVILKASIVQNLQSP